MLYRLHILTGPLLGQQITVEPAPMTAGQAADCNILIPDPELAQHHAIFEHRDDGLFVRDLGAMGRVLVNRRETHSAKLKHGDTVELGRTRLLVQAVVQAEQPAYSGRSHPRHTRRLLLLLLLLVVSVMAFWLIRPAPPPSTTKMARPPALRMPKPMPLLTTNLLLPALDHPSPSAEDLRRMHEEIAAVREAIKLLAARTQAPPRTASAPLSAVVIITNHPAAPRQAPPQHEPIAAHPVMRIVAVEQQRLPDRAEFDDMRLLHISLVPVSSNAPPPATVTVKTEFFDEDDYTGRIAPTEALCPRGVIHPEAWQGTTPVTLTVSYTVPAGLRDRQLLGGHKFHYRGYRVRLYVGAQLQAVEVHPRSLLEGTP
ncbi:MAG: FHA domain-containing protein [Verrucomicrobia bacterium]|nr:MAG: FHA domain-containing protein [Verrucomicrobiota bacterium]